MAKQLDVPGTDGDRYKDLDKLGARFFEIRKTRMELTTEEGELAGKALALLHKHGIETYRCVDPESGDLHDIYIEKGEEKAKVKKVAKPKKDADEATVE